MNKTITRYLPNTFLLLGIVVFTAGCSTITIPGSQLIGQEKKTDCIDKKTGKAIPDCQVQDKAATKREPLRLYAEKPDTTVAPSETLITSIEAPSTGASATVDTASTTIGVVASAAKIPEQAPLMTKSRAEIQALSAPAEPKISVIPMEAPTTTKAVTRAATKTVTKTETTRRLTLSGSTNFKTGSSVLNRAGKDTLAKLAKTLVGPNNNISRLLIEGYTDSVGVAAANQVLSLKRANAVADYLASQGLTRSSMETVGRGESNPVADNKTKAGRAQNRRVEITATGTRQTHR